MGCTSNGASLATNCTTPNGVQQAPTPSPTISNAIGKCKTASARSDVSQASSLIVSKATLCASISCKAGVA